MNIDALESIRSDLALLRLPGLGKFPAGLASLSLVSRLTAILLVVFGGLPLLLHQEWHAIDAGSIC
jgi:hypothetical protein